MIDYAQTDPRSFHVWLRETSRCVPDKPLTHPDHSPKPDAEVDALYQARAELAWREVRRGR